MQPGLGVSVVFVRETLAVSQVGGCNILEFCGPGSGFGGKTRFLETLRARRCSSSAFSCLRPTTCDIYLIAKEHRRPGRGGNHLDAHDGGNGPRRDVGPYAVTGSVLANPSSQTTIILGHLKSYSCRKQFPICRKVPSTSDVYGGADSVYYFGVILIAALAKAFGVHHMADEFEGALKRIDSAIAELKQNHGISIGPLESAVENLKRHSSNMRQLAEKTEALREEIILPVNAEMKKSNRIAVCFGVIGVVLTIGIVTREMFSKPADPVVSSAPAVAMPARPIIEAPNEVVSLLEQIALNVRTLAIEQLGINNEYKPAELEKKVKAYTRTEIFSSTDGEISAMLQAIREKENKEGALSPVVGVQIFFDGQPISVPGMKEYLKFSVPLADLEFVSDFVYLHEGDSVTINDSNSFTVKRIFRMKTNIMARGDTEDGALLALDAASASGMGDDHSSSMKRVGSTE